MKRACWRDGKLIALLLYGLLTAALLLVTVWPTTRAVRERWLLGPREGTLGVQWERTERRWGTKAS